MPISASDVTVGSILIDTDYDYNLVYRITGTEVLICVIQGPNTGAFTIDEMDSLTENLYYTDKIGQISVQEATAVVSTMELINNYKTVNQVHKS